MPGVQVGLVATRVLQIVFAAIVLGLGAYLAVDLHHYKEECEALVDIGQRVSADCNQSRYPPTAAYSAFAGAWGLLDAFVGLVAVFLSAGLFSWIALAFDVLAAIFFFSSGVNQAVLINDSFYNCAVFAAGVPSFCSENQADAAFSFLGCIASLAAVALVIMHTRSKN